MSLQREQLQLCAKNVDIKCLLVFPDIAIANNILFLVLIHSIVKYTVQVLTRL